MFQLLHSICLRQSYLSSDFLDMTLLTPVLTQNDSKVYCLIMLTSDYCTALLDVSYSGVAVQFHLELEITCLLVHPFVCLCLTELVKKMRAQHLW